MNRTTLAVRNIFAGFGNKIIALLLGFISRTIFIYYLGNVYLGINGLFLNILQVLSFAELGFGTALNFAMYKPIANNDKLLIEQLLNYYKKVYRIIALLIIIIGTCLIPAIPFLTKGAESITNNELMIFFSISLFNTVISYFVSYKMTYVNACQKGYIITIFDTIVNSIIIIIQIAVIVLFKSYLINLIVNSILLLGSKILVTFYLNKKFPILKLKSKEKLSKEKKKDITSNVKGLIVHQFSSIAVHATDNIIISSMISVIVVGYVSNYNLLITGITSFITIIFGSLSATFGNLYATESKEVYYNHFKTINFVNFWVYGFACMCFFVLIPPFIKLWIGAENLIDTWSLGLIVLNEYFMGQCGLFNNARNAIGNFNKDKWWAFIQAIVNLIISIIGAYYLGLIGVYIGTIVSRMIYIIFRPMSTFREMFNQNVIAYYLSYFKYLVITIIACIISYFMAQYFLLINNWGFFALGAIITFAISNLVIFLLTFWSKEFKEAYKYLKEKIRRKV